MKKNFYDAAMLVHDALRFQTNCYENGMVVRADQLVAIDDDVTSAFAAARIFYEIRMTYGYCPQVLCVGGKGLMSRHTHKKSEAELLAYVLEQLGIHRERITILGEGKNSGDNVKAVAKVTSKDAITIWCCTQRLSLRLERTQAKQAPQVKSYYYVPEQTLEDVMRLYNGKGLCEGEMLMHELASILNRCEAYAGEFQKPLEFEVPDKVRAAARLLEANFRLKLPKKTLKSYWQFIRLYVAIHRNKEAMMKELDEEIQKVAQQLIAERLVGPGDTIRERFLPTKVIGYTPSGWNGLYGLSAEHWGGEPIYAEAEFPYNLH